MFRLFIHQDIPRNHSIILHLQTVTQQSQGNHGAAFGTLSLALRIGSRKYGCHFLLRNIQAEK